MKKRIFTGLKTLALVTAVSISFSRMVMKQKPRIDTNSNENVNVEAEVPDNLGGVVFYGISPYTFEK